MNDNGKSLSRGITWTLSADQRECRLLSPKNALSASANVNKLKRQKPFALFLSPDRARKQRNREGGDEGSEAQSSYDMSDASA
jgi:hypothetical protein